MGKKSGSGSGMNNPDHISDSLKTIIFGLNRVLKFFHANPGSGMEKLRIRDPGKHPGSATMMRSTNVLRVLANDKVA
jgi:hypothetical protein